MLHTSRTWNLRTRLTRDELVAELLGGTLPLCAALQTEAGTVWANDSTSEEAIQEYAVLRPKSSGDYVQVESITVGWCDAAALSRYADEADAGRYTDEFCHVSRLRLKGGLR